MWLASYLQNMHFARLYRCLTCVKVLVIQARQSQLDLLGPHVGCASHHTPGASSMEAAVPKACQKMKVSLECSQRRSIFVGCCFMGRKDLQHCM